MSIYITIIAVVFFYLLRNKYLVRFTGVFFAVVTVKLLIPYIYISFVHPERYYSKLPEYLAILSICIVILLSLRPRRQSDREALDDIRINQSYIIVLFILGCALQVFPGMMALDQVPIYNLLDGEPHKAHENRIYFTKISILRYLIDVAQRIIFPIVAVLLAVNKRPMRTHNFILTTMLFLSSIYFQKAAPINLFVLYILFRYFSGQVKARNIIIYFSVIITIIYLFSISYGVGNAKFLDLIFRRLMAVPIQVYNTYIDYGAAFGPKFLQHNFTSITGSPETALPIEIYKFMKYGESDVGWANGFYVGDIYVNFGTPGVVICSVLIAIFVRQFNLQGQKVKTPSMYVVSLLFATGFIYYLGNNGLFSTTLVFFASVAIILNIMSRYRYTWRKINE